MSSKVRASTLEDREIIVDPDSGRRYVKGKFLGKGGFARCYELTDTSNKTVFAGKIVPKSLLVKPHQKEKMSMEIAVHRSLHHAHVVGFHGYFEDSENVYVLLEICRRRSMMELHKRRRILTEPEVRFYMRQILEGCTYLHGCKVIHRDLKLGNLFLNDDLNVKVGDFGLATRIDFDGERKRTMCGTPNYIAPEVLAKKGHSYEVDIWSIGCIMYTLLVGKPPFETKSLKETYSKIRKNDYFIPPKVSNAAQMLIVRLLRADPTERPSPEQALTDEFFTCGYMPPRLPTSCLTTAPRFTSVEQHVGLQRKPLSLVNKGEKDVEVVKKANTELTNGKPAGPMGLGGSSRTPGVRMGEEPSPSTEPLDCYLHDLYSQLTSCLASSPDAKLSTCHDDAEDPASQPVFWVSKWVDYSDKYGMGYQLCDNSVGVLFNDSTRIVLATDGENMQYIDRETHEDFHLLHSYPEALSKKVTLLKYFRNYMSEHLLKTGAGMGPREGDEIARLPHLRTWFRTRSAIVLHLSIGILQLNFFKDHTKIILCPRMGAVSYIDEAAQFRTYRLSEIEKVGCNKELATRLEYARAMVERLTTAGSGKAAGRTRTD